MSGKKKILQHVLLVCVTSLKSVLHIVISLNRSQVLGLIFIIFAEQLKIFDL